MPKTAVPAGAANAPCTHCASQPPSTANGVSAHVPARAPDVHTNAALHGAGHTHAGAASGSAVTTHCPSQGASQVKLTLLQALPARPGAGDE